MGRHDRGHDQNIGDLTDLSGLDGDGDARKFQPALVARVVIRAEGDQQQQDEDVKGRQKHSVLRDGIRIDRGHDGKHQNAQGDCQQLNDDIFCVASELLRAGGAGHDDQAEARGDQAQRQQHPVGLFAKVLQFFQKTMQEINSFGGDYSIFLL